MGGDLSITGPGCALRVVGDGGVPQVTVSGQVPRAGGSVAALLARLASAGLVMEVRDPSGRLLARVGAVRPSILGRLFGGSPAIRPTARGVVAGIRARLPGGST